MLQLKLLSLQGDNKQVCSIQQLQLVQQASPSSSSSSPAAHGDSSHTQQHAGGSSEPSGASAEAGRGGRTSEQQQQPLSQLDELRLLIQQLHQPGKQGVTRKGSAGR